MASLAVSREFPSAENKVTIWSWLFTCVVYTETIISLYVGEHLPSREASIIQLFTSASLIEQS